MLIIQNIRFAFRNRAYNRLSGSGLLFHLFLSSTNGQIYMILEREVFVLQYMKMENKLIFGVMIKIKAKK
jgi:hypothetical protein